MEFNISPPFTFTQVIARGKVIHQWVKVRNVGVISSFRFRLLPEMSPSSRLVAFFFGKDGEVVADSVLLKINDGLPNKVNHLLEFSFSVSILLRVGFRVFGGRKTAFTSDFGSWLWIWLRTLVGISNPAYSKQLFGISNTCSLLLLSWLEIRSNCKLVNPFGSETQSRYQ